MVRAQHAPRACCLQARMPCVATRVSPTLACLLKCACSTLPSLLGSWRYGEVSGNPRWKGLSWGMLPCLGSAMCACTWHFFYNSPDLQVRLQGGSVLWHCCRCT